MSQKKKESISEYMARIGRKGAHAAKAKLTTKDRQRYGKRGGRPRLRPEERAAREKARLQKRLKELA